MKKKVLLINPPWYRFFIPRRSFPPLGLLYMAAVLEEGGFDVVVYHADYSESSSILKLSQMTQLHNRYIDRLKQISHPLWQESRDTIQELSPDVIGISVTTSAYQSALNIARIAKGLSRDITVILGGFHPTLLPEETVKNKDVDIVVRGEGEYTLLETVRELNSSRPRLDKIPGISFKKGDKIIHNPERGLIQDLDALPHPARHKIIPEVQLKPGIDYTPLIATRGCPYFCTYCASHKIWKRIVRFRSPENIIREIEDIKSSFGLNPFTFYDDSLTLNFEFVQKLCRLISKKRLGIEWICQARVNEISVSLLEIMKDAGCIGLNIGVESVNPATLKRIRKAISVAEIKKACKLVKEFKLELNIFMIFGFFWETQADVKIIEEFLDEVDPDWVFYSHATPYPGTELYRDYKEHGFLSGDMHWHDFYQESPKMFMAKEYLLEEMEKVFDRHNEKKLLEQCAQYVKK